MGNLIRCSRVEFEISYIQDLAVIMSKQDAESRSNSLELTKMLVRIQELGDLIKSLPEDSDFPTETI